MSDTPGEADPSGTLPLAGLRVLDLTRLLPGPLAARHLLELGAGVVKIEGPAAQGRDDGMRAFWQTPDEAARGEPGLMYRELNAGKRVLELDLRDPAGRAQLLALARDADVLIEGFRPGAMARLGLDWPLLHAANPRLVMCAITGYGQHSAWAQRAGHDINYLAMAGVLEQIAGDDGQPALPNFQIADLMGGTQAAVSRVLAALLAVHRGGRGRFVDVSMTHEVWRHQLVARLVPAASGGRARPGRELLSGGVPCYGLYRTADRRHLAVGALELGFWRALCDVLQRPHWRDRHWSLGQVVGGDDAMALRAELGALIASQPLAHWVERFDPADCCVTPVLRVDEAGRHPLFVERESQP